MEYIVLSIPLFFLLMGIELAWSVWSRSKAGLKDAPIYRFNDFIANLGCGIGSQVVGAFTKTFIFAVYLWTYDHCRLLTLPNTALTWVVAFLLVDMLYYWFHRLSHEVNFLWAAHIVHHQSEEYNLSVALRQSWWQGLFSWWFYLPMAVLGIQPVLIVTVGAINTLYQFWIHTKAIDRMGWLEHVLNTPSHHRVHHGSDPKYLDRNHAGTLIIWDKLFGTFQREEEEPVYGITTPLESWDPVRANFHYWGDLIGLAERCRNAWDKIRVFLKPPGWRPAYLGGPVIPQEHDRASHRKFETSDNVMFRRYVGIQFTLLLAVTTVFLFMHERLPNWSAWALAGLIILWVMDMGLMLEGQRRGLMLESFRIMFLSGIGLAIAVGNWDWALLLPVALFTGVASLIHLAVLFRETPDGA